MHGLAWALMGNQMGFTQKTMEYIEDELGQVAAMQTAFWTSVPTVHTIGYKV